MIGWNLDISRVWKRRGPRRHHSDSTRSDEWNAWRTRQALTPQGKIIPYSPAPRSRAVTERDRLERRKSTRAARRRQHRAHFL